MRVGKWLMAYQNRYHSLKFKKATKKTNIRVTMGLSNDAATARLSDPQDCNDVLSIVRDRPFHRLFFNSISFTSMAQKTKVYIYDRCIVDNSADSLTSNTGVASK